MSTAAATLAAPPARKGLPKIALVIAAVLLVLAAAGGGAYYWFVHRAAAQEASDDEPQARRKEPPSFMALEVFTVNLADKDADRFVQIGVSFELASAKGADEIKPFVPAVRNAILMVIADKTSGELLERAGKEKLARQIRIESLRAMGFEAEAATDEDDDAVESKATKKKRKARAEREAQMPIRQVHFASFIIN